MTSAKQNELMSHVVPGAPLHDLMKHYWMPVLRTHALEAGGAPHPVTLLGEEYVAFRADDGRVGFFDAHCPHRGAPLVLARNEDCALRCLYHGWKIDVSGKVVECPSEPPERRKAFAAKVKVDAYPTRESGGLVWVWLAPGEPDPFPTYEFDGLDEPYCYAYALPTESNWLQTVEGDLDAAHASALHRSTVLRKGQMNHILDDFAPRWELRDHRWGMTATAIRETPDGNIYARANQYVFPITTFISFDKDSERLVFFAMPIDNYRCIQWAVYWHPDRPVPDDSYAARYCLDLDPDPNDTMRSFHEQPLWGQDRAAMAADSWTGLQGIAVEDLAMFEGQGALVDRTREHLGSSDLAVVKLRQFILDAIESFEGGDPIPGADPEFPYEIIVGRSVVIGPDERWEDKV